MFDYNVKVRTGEITLRKVERAKYIESAVKIQRAWRRYITRKNTRKRIARLEEVLGMTIPSWRSRETFAKDEQNFQRRRALMPAYDAHVEAAFSDERTRVKMLRIEKKNVKYRKRENRFNPEQISESCGNSEDPD